jgi:hypothetical protein
MASAREKLCFRNTGAAFLNAGPVFVLSVCDGRANEGNTINQYLHCRKTTRNRADGISNILRLSYPIRSTIESDGISQLHEDLQRFICALLTRLAAAVPWRQPLSAYVNSRRGDPHKTPVTW